MLKLSQYKHTISLQYVLGPFLSTDISDQIIWRRRLTMAFMTMVLTSPWTTLSKLFPVSCHTQPHLRTCRRMV